MTSGRWLRVRRGAVCPICSHNSWCSVSDDGAIVACMRVLDGSYMTKQTSVGIAYLHRLRERDLATPPPPRRVDLRPVVNWTKSADARCAATADSDLAPHARELGVEVRTLRTYSCFVTPRWPRALCIPMHDALGRCCGVRMRTAGGRKWSAPGGREGVFLPSLLPTTAEPLLVAEGASDAFAGHELGFWTVGRPSATGGARIVSEIVRQHEPPRVVVLGDNDDVGRRGAEALAQELRIVCQDVRVVIPPEHHKDLRDAMRAGLTRDDLLARIDGSASLLPLRAEAIA